MGCFPCSGRIIKCKAERINRRMPLRFVCMTLYNKILDFGVAVMASLFWGRRGGLCPNLFIEPSRRGGWYPGSSRAGITPRRPRGVTVVPRMAPVWGGKEAPLPFPAWRGGTTCADLPKMGTRALQLPALSKMAARVKVLLPARFPPCTAAAARVARWRTYWTYMRREAKTSPWTRMATVRAVLGLSPDGPASPSGLTRFRSAASSSPARPGVPPPPARGRAPSRVPVTPAPVSSSSPSRPPSPGPVLPPSPHKPQYRA